MILEVLHRPWRRLWVVVGARKRVLVRKATCVAAVQWAEQHQRPGDRIVVGPVRETQRPDPYGYRRSPAQVWIGRQPRPPRARRARVMDEDNT